MRFADLDAVTVDAFGTLVELIDPVSGLQDSLAERAVERSADEIRAAFHAEVAYYRAHLAEGGDPESLARLRTRCTQVFLDALGSALPASDFAPFFVSALRFRALDGVEQALRALRAHGLVVAVVANWDIGLEEHLDEIGLGQFFSVVEALAGKPSPEGLLRTLRTLEVEPGRVLHIGDEASDETAARAAGAQYLPAPLPDAVASLR